MYIKLKEIFDYQEMINSLVRRELRGKYAKSVLGFLWSFLNPMFQILIYTFVFSVIFRNDLDNYYIFLMSGLLPWTFFADSFSSGAVAINGNAEMVKKIYFPREVLVIAEVNAKLINMLLSFIVMGVFILISGTGFSWQLVFLPIVIAEEYLFALGCSLIVSAITVYLKDMEYIVNVILMAWVWGTPIMYNYANISGLFQKALGFNPMTPIVLTYQDIFYWHKTPEITRFLIPLLVGLAVLAVGEVLFSKLSRRFAEEM